MKYLLLIIQHLFPRKQWTEVQRYKIMGENVVGDGDIPIAIIIEQSDQFGNIRTRRVSH